MGTERPFSELESSKVKMTEETKKPGRPKGRKPKGAGKSGYTRFVKQNMEGALAEKKKKGDGQSHFKILGAWWKDLSPELKENSTKKKTSSTPFPSKGPRVGSGMAPSMEKRLDI